jgi:hypothetical protein
MMIVDTREYVTPLRIAAQQAIEAEKLLCEKLRTAINSAFGDKVVSKIRATPTEIGINFEIVGHWELPDDLWFKPFSQGN